MELNGIRRGCRPCRDDRAAGTSGTGWLSRGRGAHRCDGSTGSEWACGPEGPAGANGTNGSNGTGFNFRNAFDPSASYAVDDVATYNGSTYVAIATSQGPNNGTPDVNAAWTLMAEAGAAGAAGATGTQGPQGAQG